MKICYGALVLLTTLFLPATAHLQTTAPAPYGVTPKPYQLKVLEMEMYALMHFSTATYQNKQWGYGDADPKIFNPTKFDANQIVQAVKAGGFKGITVVAKHHDGFCLFPTKTTEYNITKSPFRNGKGDLVKEMETAIRKAGLSMGLYCSPWDRNSEYYGTDKYVKDVFYEQLRELYTRYGPLYTVFFDGANGGDGYYGGTNEKRKIDAPVYYNFEKLFQMARELQPAANIFSDIGPDLRWVGNESGEAAETSWATFTPIGKEGKKPAPGFVNESNLGTGTRIGENWTPAECDVPLRHGWFYSPDDDNNVRSPEKLLEIYYASVGRGATLDLGISPNLDGLITKGDAEKMARFGQIIKATFNKNLAAAASITASNTRGKSAKYATKYILDNDRYSYWASDDAVTNPELIVALKQAAKFNVIRLRENIKLGQRIESVEIDIWKNNNWETLASATSIGANRLIRLPNYVTSSKLRIRINSPVCVTISDFGLYAEPEYIVAGLSKNNTAYTNNKKAKNWKSAGNEAAFDNDVTTIYTAATRSPSALIIDLGKAQPVKTFEYLPRQDNVKSGLISKYSYYYSPDGKTWKLAKAGEFSNIVNSPILQTINLPKPVIAKYIKFVADEIAEGDFATIAELGVR